MKLANGFYTALGTPIDDKGDLVADSLALHIEQQITEGAAGLLLMGTMGAGANLKNATFKEAVYTAVKANKKRIPLFVGAMDTSIVKVMEKINLIKGCDIDGIVLTVPFYDPVTEQEAINFYTRVADISPYPIYMYDHAIITSFKITLPMMDKLISHPNIKGMKTPDWQLIKGIERFYPDSDFECLYSGLDTFDYGRMMGIAKSLDGMFSCCPKNGKKIVDANEKGDYKAARKYLDNILKLRDTMLECDIMPSFTYCMNLLGCDGYFHYDVCSPLREEVKPILKNLMEEIGEI
ncbi:MAG: dihydrodipicolinate synthase family protein [Clostridia bacterium]|nr:dihydrodipicolinate synthase family protein [Clostridia bacterium]